MDIKRDIVADRDRFVGFAFAAADLLLELDANGDIRSAMGAAQALLGHSQSASRGKSLLSFFIPRDRPVGRRLLQSLDQRSEGARLDPFQITLAHPGKRPVTALLGGCKLPASTDGVLVTLTALPASRSDSATAAQRDPDSGLLQSDAFFSLAATLSTDPAGRERKLSLVRIDGLTAAVEQLPESEGKDLMAEVGGALRARSLNADTAARLDGDDFGLVEDPAAAAGKGVEAEIAEIARLAGLAQDALKTDIAMIALPQGAANAESAARVLAYAVRRVTESNIRSLGVSGLERGLPEAVTKAVTGMADLQRVIRAGEVNLVYQPIVALNTREIHHYEALTRFPDGRNTFEAVTFAEAVGMTEELDLSVCRSALKELARVGGRMSIAVNVSGGSVTNDAFRHRLHEMLQPLSLAERRRLMFELTESSVVEGVRDASVFLAGLKKAGHAICLDDFGAGAAAYAYLRHFDVDIVKVDGAFLKAALQRDRERALIRSVCRLCRDLDCSVIGEMIEDERAAEAAARLGIDYGQGWLFGKPVPELPVQETVTQRRRARG